jgi:hypothetical protein
MDDILRAFDFCFSYIDDILLYSRSPQAHEQHLRTLLKQLQAYGIVLNPGKCVCGATEVTFLGYRISGKGSQPLPDRDADLQACPPPQTTRHLRRFLWMLNFYRRFCLSPQPRKHLYTPSSPAHVPKARRPSPGHQPSATPSRSVRPVLRTPPCLLTRTALLPLPW